MSYIDLESNEWIKDIPENERADVINRVLKLGHMVLSLSQVSINPMNTLFDPIKSQMDMFILENKNNMDQIGGRIKENINEIKSSVDFLTKTKHNSNLKGKLGEFTIEKIIQEAFPDDNLINMSQSTSESDYHFIFNNYKILIEIKTYGSNVPTSEINKFKRDLDRSGVDLGIFVSTTSGITGYKRFEIEEENKKIIYIPNSGFDGSAIIWSIILAKKILEIKTKITNIEKKNYEEYFQMFENEYNNICKLRYDIQKGKNSIDQIFETLYLQALNIEIKLKNVIKEATNKLEIECSDEFKYTNKDEYLEDLVNSKNKNVNNISKLIALLDSKKLDLSFNSDYSKWKIKKNNDSFGIVKVKKTKLELEINNPHINVECNDSGLNFLKTII
jgi:hypothetical protein